MLSRTTARSGARAALVLIVALLAAIGLAGTAHAHASLVGSDPADGAVLSTAPTVVTLTFDDALADFEPVVTVTGPDGNQYQSGVPTVDGAQLTSAVDALPAAGAYTIAYRVVSDDGHPVEGTVRFELAAAAVAPAAIPSPAPTPAGVTTEPTTGVPTTVPTATTSVPTGPAATSSVSPSLAPTVTSSADAASSSSTTGWSGWQWLMVVLFIALAFLATLVVRKRMEASARTRSGE